MRATLIVRVIPRAESIIVREARAISRSALDVRRVAAPNCLRSRAAQTRARAVVLVSSFLTLLSTKRRVEEIVLWKSSGQLPGSVRPRDLQLREITPEIATIGRCDAMCLSLGMRTDQKVWYEMFARTAASPILAEKSSRQLRALQ